MRTVYDSERTSREPGLRAAAVDHGDLGGSRRRPPPPLGSPALPAAIPWARACWPCRLGGAAFALAPSSAQCFTSLEGASFSLSPTNGTNVTLQNSWVGGAFGAGQVQIVNDGGVVRFRGAVSSGSTTMVE